MTITTKMGVTTPGVGGSYSQPALNSLNWNVPLNTNFDIINQSVGGAITKTFSSVDVTLSADEAKNAFINCTGTLSANCKLILPAVAGWYIIGNFTTGAFTLTVGNPTGSAVVAPPGQIVMVFSFGSNVAYANNGDLTPAGTVSMFAGSAAPTGWVLCDGSSYSTTGLYSALFGAIGYTWGGSGATFTVPDLRGMFVRGTGTNGAYPSAVGAAVGGYQADDFGSHTHTANVTDPGHSHVYERSNGGTVLAGTVAVSVEQGRSNQSTTSVTTGITVANTSSGGSETRPKNYSMWYIIKI